MIESSSSIWVILFWKRGMDGSGSSNPNINDRRLNKSFKTLSLSSTTNDSWSFIDREQMEEYHEAEMFRSSRRRRRRKKRVTKKSKEMTKEEEEWRLPQLTPAEYARLAIDIVRKQREKEYASHEFIKPLGCKRFLAYIPRGDPGLVEVSANEYEVGDYCHISFIATRKKNDDNDDYGDYYDSDDDNEDDQVLIFAELIDRGYNEFQVADWGILKHNSSRVYHGCAFCPPEKNYPHPIIGSFIGQCEYDHKHSIKASQLDLAASFKNLVLSIRNKTYKSSNNIILHLTLPDPSIFSPELPDDVFATTALSSINEKEDVDFEFVRTLGCRRQKLVIDGYKDWCHVCFIAKPKNDNDSQEVYFFAELCDPGVKNFSVNTYSRIDPSAAGTIGGCGICPENENFLHPPIGSYTAGDFPPFGNGCITTSDDDE